MSRVQEMGAMRLSDAQGKLGKWINTIILMQPAVTEHVLSTNKVKNVYLADTTMVTIVNSHDRTNKNST